MLDRVMFQQQRGWLRELVRGQDVIIQKNNQTGLAGMEEAVHIPYHTDTHTHTQTDRHTQRTCRRAHVQGCIRVFPMQL